MTQPLPSLAGAAWLEKPEAQRVLGAIETAGFSARVVGGCVRNGLLGVPVTDVDIATTAVPADVQRIAKAAGMAIVPTGIEHGTITVIANHLPFEVTTLRRDVATDGRRAVVAFTLDWTEDAARRDFTLNALYCDARGKVHDPLGGYGDLVARRVRFIGDASARIREDYLRILRFFRFHATYGVGDLDRDGTLACVRLRAGLGQLSGERVGAEMLRLLVADRSTETIEAMFGLGLLVDVLAVAPRPMRFARLVSIEGALQTPADAALRLAALAMHVAEDAGRIAERLRLSKTQQAVLRLTAVREPELGIATSDQEARRALYRLGADNYQRRIRLAWAQSGEPPDHECWLALHALPARAPVLRFPLAGRDLLALGLVPGPEVGQLLKRIEDQWIASGFTIEAEQLREMAKVIISGAV